MTLREWRVRNGLSLEQAAALFGTLATVVSKWELGRQIPRRQFMRVIWEKTEYQVDANSFYGLVRPMAEAA